MLSFFVFFNLSTVYGECVRTYPVGDLNYYCANYEADWCESTSDCASLGNYCTYDTRCVNDTLGASPYACQTWYCSGTCYGTCGDDIYDPEDPPGGDDPPPNNWAGIKGQVWFDFNGNGVWNEDEEFFGNPMEGGDNDSRCNSNPGVRNKDFDVMVHRDDGSAVNYAKVWVCWPGNSAHYFSHFDGYPGWTWDYSMGRHGNYIISLHNIPSTYACDTWTTYDLSGNLQNSGPGCEAPLYVTGWNGYSTIDWKLKLSGCSTDSDCADTLFCTDDVCDLGTGECSNPAKTCNDSNLCTSDSCNETTDTCVNTNNPVNGSLFWGDCSGGHQVSTCEGYDCGGNCSAECVVDGGIYNNTTHVCTRPCLYVEGNIWSDWNGDGTRQLSETFKDSSLSGCSTTSIYNNFYLWYTGETGNQITRWWCHTTPYPPTYPDGLGSYYGSPAGVAANIEPEQPHSFTLSNWPAGYKPKSWSYNHPGYSASGSWTSGDFTTLSILMPSSGPWTNVHWELEQEKYNLEIIVKKIKPEIINLPDQCTDSGIYDGSLEDASVTVYDADDVSQPVCSGSSNSEGKLTCPIWILQGPLKIEARKDVPGLTPETFTLKCPNDISYEYDPGSVNEGETKTADIGLQTSYKDGWVSAIDSDIFANQISVVVPAGPTNNKELDQTPQGFAKTLINSSGNTDRYLGFIFSESDDKSNPDVDAVCPDDTKGFETTNPCIELGGFSYNLISGGEHDSKWLEKFTFQPPIDPIEAIDLTWTGKPVFESGGVYELPISAFNLIMDSPGSPIEYVINNSGVAILYLTGGGEAVIARGITTNSSGRLLIVVNGSVRITEDPGTSITATTPTMSDKPNIMAGIIASGTIEIESQGTADKDNFDKAIMFTAPFISRSGLTFSRDLYHDNNATMPAESAKAFNKYLYLLTSLEREESADNLYFTGLTTFDIDWEYIY